MEYKLSAKKREDKGDKARSQGMLPAVAYGAGQDNISLFLDYNNFTNLYSTAGASSLIDFEVDSKDNGKILIHDVQQDPVTDRIIHVDLRRIDMNKEISTMVVLNFVSEPPAVKEQGGTLVKNIEEVEVKCLPKNLVAEIEVDLSVLKTFDDSIKVKDLALPAGLTITNPGPEDVIAKALPALTEEQIKAMEKESTDVSQVEVAGEKEEKEEVEKGKDEKGKTEDKGEEKKDKGEGKQEQK